MFDYTSARADDSDMRLPITILSLGLVLACDVRPAVPEGYTPEAWERIQRDYPDKAQLIKWVDARADLRKLNKEAEFAFSDEVKLKMEWEVSFNAACEEAMLRGRPIKDALIEKYGIFARKQDYNSNQSQRGAIMAKIQEL